ncbi:unnamed protein product [Acanthoscelides obtectus]|uniref:Uncharacterized protein n=1 Tax=Acanthoscelides obtectus TaxID=200917 RepID=A0A9P0LLX7_ACAOB|nr:unnamed protein product [Acanthoscelides obtectus]CAH1995058.1 unnamed protein product [Acanthoscelides obtectus]CAK1635262.1 hypothetical protein AOBTE_LOCUS9163 [Acanthoscelides obtectus]CAK1635414.1 hypothetical protein AOBTE_LOCUS9260 [Acanthoscelides obtectus]
MRSNQFSKLVCWQIQNGIFECVNCFFWRLEPLTTQSVFNFRESKEILKT